MAIKKKETFSETESLCEYDEGPFWDVTPEQEKELVELLEKVVYEWQAKNNINCNSKTFSHTRNYEVIETETVFDE